MTPGWDHRRRRIAFGIEVAAIRCFAVDGYHAVTVEQIAQAAGIHERTFFRYFATKDDVMLALPRRSIDALCEALRDRPAEEDLYEAFAAAVSVAAEVLHEDAELRLVTAQIFADTPDLVTRASGEFTVRLSTSVAAAVAPRLGEPPESMRVGVMTSVLTGVLQFAWSRWFAQGGHNDIADLVSESLRLVETTQVDGAPTPSV